MKESNVIMVKNMLPQFFGHSMALYLGEFIAWAYYYIVLYQLSGNFSVLLREFVFYMIGIWIGFVISSFTLDKFGYLKLFRTASFVQGISMLITAMLLPNILSVFTFIALFRGMGRGLYWPAHHSFKLKEVTGADRAVLINTLQSVILLLGIVIPVLAGALLSYTNNFQYSLFVAAISFFVISLIPFKVNKRARSRISSIEITRIISHRYFKRFALLHFVNDGFTQLIHILFLIIPYILIGNTFGVGVLTSFIGVAAAISALTERKKPLESRVKLGYFSFSLHFILTAFLSIFWSIPVLIVRSMGLPIMSSLGFTVREDLDYRIREKILGDFTHESTIEMNLVVETIFLFSRVIIGLIFLAILEFLKEDSYEFLRICIFVASLVILICFHCFKKFNENFKIV